ncbi:probable trehalose-phosphate phosphatase D isoform X1 [Hordeum vulgare subsp. vulgare]|uniref:probable trehalose-phosphate phosphatase D isoform X1 n=1 Tax=Hordeum vulgare subsp. vulgare TaxID=112509 RepID=UPI001D1A514C|nr:probable trehalose-phosphate phosphatase D isoform X1 [Hordeum vulgare subsp. vulgare]
MYASLQAKRPSAIDCFAEITTNWQGKTIALFLDYDGTLSPKVNNPDEAYMSSEMRDVVQEVASLCATSVVGGRARDKVKSFIMLENLHYAGSHGADIKLSDEAEAYQPTSEYEPVINGARERLEEVIRDIKGASVENKQFCISVHYRVFEKKKQELVKKLVKKTIKGFPELRVTDGDKVLEVGPNAEFNKGYAVKYLLEQLARKNNWDSSQVVAIFIGDDRTDEDAFKVEFFTISSKHGNIILLNHYLIYLSTFFAIRCFVDETADWGSLSARSASGLKRRTHWRTRPRCKNFFKSS